MSCEFCKNADFSEFSTDVTGGYAHISLAAGSYRFPKDEQFAFCPRCGEPLFDPQPLTLDELRERDGKPVFTKTIGVIGSGRWELLSFDDHWLYLKTAHEHYKMTISELEGSYGNSWIAYDRPPKEA